MKKDLVPLDEKQLSMVNAGAFPSEPRIFFCSGFRHKPITIEDFYRVAAHLRIDFKKLHILLHTSIKAIEKFMAKAEELGYSTQEARDMLALIDIAVMF